MLVEGRGIAEQNKEQHRMRKRKLSFIPPPQLEHGPTGKKWMEEAIFILE